MNVLNTFGEKSRRLLQFGKGLFYKNTSNNFKRLLWADRWYFC